jgi:hypothetical protein
MMPYEQLLRSGRIRPHRTNRQEIAALLGVVTRDLKDAAITALSADRRFATAYNAVLQAATAIMYSEGFRSQNMGHHATVFEFMREALGPDFCDLADYFDACRRKRNVADCVGVGSVSNTEAEELLREASAFAISDRNWIQEHHSELSEGAPQ